MQLILIVIIVIMNVFPISLDTFRPSSQKKGSKYGTAYKESLSALNSALAVKGTGGLLAMLAINELTENLQLENLWAVFLLSAFSFLCSVTSLLLAERQAKKNAQHRF